MKAKTHKKQVSKSDPTIYRTSDPTITIRIPKRRTKDSPISAIAFFKSIDSEFTITATPEAWLKLHEKCFGPSDTWEPLKYRRQGLFNDIKPFIRAAYLDAIKVPSETGKKNLRKILYIQAAIIHDLWNEMVKGVSRDERKRDIKLQEDTFKMFWSIWHEEIKYGKLKKHSTKSMKSFYKQYINDGRKYFDGDKKTLSFFVRSLRDFMDEMKKDNSSGYKGNKHFQTVDDMNVAIIALLEGLKKSNFAGSSMIQTFMTLSLRAFPTLK